MSVALGANKLESAKRVQVADCRDHLASWKICLLHNPVDIQFGAVMIDSIFVGECHFDILDRDDLLICDGDSMTRTARLSAALVKPLSKIVAF